MFTKNNVFISAEEPRQGQDIDQILEEFRRLKERRQQDHNLTQMVLTVMSQHLDTIQESQERIVRSQRLQQACMVSMCRFFK